MMHDTGSKMVPVAELVTPPYNALALDGSLLVRFSSTLDSSAGLNGTFKSPDGEENTMLLLLYSPLLKLQTVQFDIVLVN